MVEAIEMAFPRLRDAEWHVSSSRADDYNCIAWAAQVTTAWWWPEGIGKTYWPESAPRQLTLEAFRQAFATMGYAVCAGADREAGFEQVAIFANDQGVPTHAARQLDSGRWTSKLGKLEDIDHALDNLEGALYGTVALVLKRPAKAVKGE